MSPNALLVVQLCRAKVCLPGLCVAGEHACAHMTSCIVARKSNSKQWLERVRTSLLVDTCYSRQREYTRRVKTYETSQMLRRHHTCNGALVRSLPRTIDHVRTDSIDSKLRSSASTSGTKTNRQSCPNAYNRIRCSWSCIITPCYVPCAFRV